MSVDVRGVAYLGAVVVTGLVAWQIVKAVKAVGETGGNVAGAVTGAVANAVQAVNPFNRDNAIAGTVNQTVKNATGEPTLGGWLASIFDPATRAADRAAAELNSQGGAAGRVSSSQAKLITQFTAADQDDADAGAAMRALELGVPYISAADIEDMEAGAAMRTGGADVARLAVSPGFSYLTRTGRSF